MKKPGAPKKQVAMQGVKGVRITAGFAGEEEEEATPVRKGIAWGGEANCDGSAGNEQVKESSAPATNSKGRFKELLMQLESSHNMEMARLNRKVEKYVDMLEVMKSKAALAQSAQPPEDAPMRLPGAAGEDEDDEEEEEDSSDSEDDDDKQSVVPEGKTKKDFDLFATLLDKECPTGSFRAWALHVKTMNSHGKFSVHDLLIDDTGWKAGGGSRSRRSLKHKPVVANRKPVLDKDEDTTILKTTGKGWLAGLMMYPMSRRRLAWDLIGALFLLWDFVVLPLSAFGVDSIEGIDTMEWVTLLYWTADVPASLLTGFAEKGMIVLSPQRTLHRYLRSWFILDLAVLVPDWIMAIVKLISSGSGDIGNFGRLLRTMRGTRTLRVLRLAKVKQLVRKVEDGVTSESVFVVIRIMIYILSILGVSHILTAVWYEIGKSELIESHDSSWIYVAGLEGTDAVHLYLSSMHWTLAQFTPATTNVSAQSATERLFAMFVIMIGLCVFSSFVSAITGSMSQLANASSAQSQQLWILRKYLKQHNIQGSLHYRIMRHLEYAYQKERETIPDSKVKALHHLSAQLKTELLATVSLSCLRDHPLFEHLGHMLDSLRNLTSAVGENHLANQDVLFSNDQAAKSMDCPEDGSFAYARFAHGSFLGKKDSLLIDVEVVVKGGWLCEAALWTEWKHLGTAQAAEETHVVSLLAKEFLQVAKEDVVLLSLSRRYARMFVEMLQERCYRGLSDVLYKRLTENEIHAMIEIDPSQGENVSSSSKLWNLRNMKPRSSTSSHTGIAVLPMGILLKK